MAAQEGILSGLSRFEVAGIPVGAAATGALAAGLFDGLVGLVQGVAPQVPSWAMKAVGAWAAIQWGPRLLGSTAAQTAGLFLAYDSIQELINLRGLISGLFQGLRPGSSAPAVAPAAPQGTPETLEQYLAMRGL